MQAGNDSESSLHVHGPHSFENSYRYYTTRIQKKKKKTGKKKKQKIKKKKTKKKKKGGQRLRVVIARAWPLYL